MTIASVHPVQEFMTLLGLTQTEAADELNCAASTVSRILKDDRWPTAEMVFHMEKRSEGQITLERCHSYFSASEEEGDGHD